jgi:hypothetical protein
MANKTYPNATFQPLSEKAIRLIAAHDKALSYQQPIKQT